jgi:hypothetical protein
MQARAACTHAHTQSNIANMDAGLLFDSQCTCAQARKVHLPAHTGVAHAHACARGTHTCKRARKIEFMHADMLFDTRRTCAQASKVHLPVHTGVAHAHATARSMHICKHAQKIEFMHEICCLTPIALAHKHAKYSCLLTLVLHTLTQARAAHTHANAHAR